MANRFGRRAVHEDESRGEAARFFWLPKFMYWLLLTSGLAVCLTMLLSMLPIFGTEGMEVLLDIHRFTGMLAVVALVLHLYCVLLQLRSPALTSPRPMHISDAGRAVRVCASRKSSLVPNDMASSNSHRLNRRAVWGRPPCRHRPHQRDAPCGLF